MLLIWSIEHQKLKVSTYKNISNNKSISLWWIKGWKRILHIISVKSWKYTKIFRFFSIKRLLFYNFWSFRIKSNNSKWLLYGNYNPSKYCSIDINLDYGGFELFTFNEYYFKILWS